MVIIDRYKIFWRKVDRQIFVTRIDTGIAYVLEGSAGFIWDLVVSNRDFQEIAAMVAETYGIEVQLAAEDVKTFLIDLRTEGLIEA